MMCVTLNQGMQYNSVTFSVVLQEVEIGSESISDTGNLPVLCQLSLKSDGSFLVAL